MDNFKEIAPLKSSLTSLLALFEQIKQFYLIKH